LFVEILDETSLRLWQGIEVHGRRPDDCVGEAVEVEGASGRVRRTGGGDGEVGGFGRMLAERGREVGRRDIAFGNN
jgi:hypothetical protein